MTQIRAYKLAEELGVDRNELVEKAQAFGVALKSPMASLTEAEAQLLREKIGGARSGQVVERRVERAGGAAVIRRRKRVAPPPKPEPVAPAPELAEGEEGAAAQPVLPGVSGVEPEAPAPEAPVLEPSAPVAPAVAERPAAAAEPRGGEAVARRGEGDAAAAPGRGKQRKRVREVVNLREQEQIARQVTSRTLRRSVTVDPRALASPRRRRRDAPAPKPVPAAKPKPARRVVRVEGAVAVAELARLLGVKAADLQGRLMALGTMASLNQSIEVDTARQLAEAYGFELEDVGFREEEFLGAEPVTEGERVPRPPIVTVMGHVDHGKTSLLDAMRKTNVVSGEAGGITQHIGAYQVAVGDKRITFIDTPGHEAFTLMRARGAHVTDLVVLVVAASEGIMPQTVEAIAHARAAGVPILVAVNKCDLPEANPAQVRQRLMEHGLVPEEFGGDTICVDVSALKGSGLDQLLEMILLQAEVLELKAHGEKRAQGIVLEARLDRGRGVVATVLVQDGTLHQGDTLVVGTSQGRVRAMENERGQRLKQAGPAMPVQVIGLSEVPEAGQAVHAVESERVAREIAEHRAAEQRGRPVETRPRRSLEEIFAEAEGEGPKELTVVLKGDVHGSVEAVRDALEKLSTETVQVKVIHAGVGAISESDVMLAKASDAVVIGFNVRPDSAARRSAEGQGVDVRAYTVIYELTDDVRKAMAGLLPPRLEEKVLGRAEVRRIFQVPRAGTVAGSYVTEGLVRRNARCRLLRDGVQVWDGRIGSLKRFKDDAREVQSGFECGIGIESFNDVKVGDVVEAYEVQEAPAQLE